MSHVPCETILTYGSVELCLYPSYHAGETIHIHSSLCADVVDRVEKADGIVILAMIPREGIVRPSCQCILFTHYYRRRYQDTVDHLRTCMELRTPTEALRRLTEQAFHHDMTVRSISASLTYVPKVRYL